MSDGWTFLQQRQRKVDMKGSSQDNSKQSMAGGIFSCVGLAVWGSLGVHMMRDVKILKDWDLQEKRLEGDGQSRVQSIRRAQLS